MVFSSIVCMNVRRMAFFDEGTHHAPGVPTLVEPWQDERPADHKADKRALCQFD
jgi:hypothetical protein